MKRKLLAILMATAMVFGLAACGNKETPANTNDTPASSEASEENGTAPEGGSDEQITLRMGWWGSQTRHDLTVEVIEMYEEANPNINIEYEFFSFDDYFTKLKTLVASDQVWDIFQLGGNFPMYMDKIYFIDEFVESGVIDTSDIPEGYLQATQDFEGNQIGLTNGVNAYGIAYDVDMFNDAGVPLPTENWTWDEYAAAARAIHENTGHFGISDYAASEFIAGCSTLIPQYGELGQYSFFNLELTDMGFDDPSMLEPYIKMKSELIAEGAAPDAGAAAEITNIENDFLVTGEAGMTWVAANQFSTIYDICKAEGRTLALAPLPRLTADGPSGAAIQSSQMMCVSQDSQYKEEAAKFINWFVNSVECNNVLQGERGLPANNSVRAALEENATESQKLVYNYMDLIGSFEMPEKINVLSPDGQDLVQDNYINYIQQVVFGEISVEDAAQKTYDDAKAIFAK